MGSAEFLRFFFGLDEAPSQSLIDRASPARFVKAGAAPLLCIHSRNDSLVFPMHSLEAARAWREVGACAKAVLFNGTGKAHGLFDSDDLETREAAAPVCTILREVLPWVKAGDFNSQIRALE